MYDILIKNATVVDGSGAKAFRGDVGVKEDKISAVGELKREKGRREIDATGLVVAPGFIDIQNHSDSYGALLAHPALESMLYQGITTVLVGQCGSSLAPLLKGSLASIQKWASIEGVNVDWLSAAEFFRVIEAKKLGVNLATLVGHATLRRDFALDAPRSLTEKEKRQVERLYQRSLREGAWGLSVGLEYTHERPADEQELIDLLTLTAQGRGVASFHLRDEGREVAAAIQEVIYLTRKSGAKVKISHFKKKLESNPEFAKELLLMVEKAAADGLEICFDVYPYAVSATVLYLLLPEWASEGGRADLLQKIKNETLRKEIIDKLRSYSLPYEKITIAAGSLDSTFIGKTVAELARRRAAPAEEIILDLLSASEDRVVVFFKNLHEPIVELFLAHPQAMISSDGSGQRIGKHNPKELAHPRSFGTTARVLGHYVRERKIFPLETAVYKMSGLPAKFLGLAKRGLIKTGNYADLVLFDPNKIADLATFENPYRRPQGISLVIVNGRVTIDNDKLADQLAGRVLRK